MIDLAAELAEALDRLGLTPEALRALVREELRRARAETEAEVLVDLRGLAALLGRTAAATKQLLVRPSGAELAAMALRVGGRRRWRRSEVVAWLEAQRR